MAVYAVPRGEPVVPKEDCSPFDIGFVYSTISKASPAEKFRLSAMFGSLLWVIFFPHLLKLQASYESADTSG